MEKKETLREKNRKKFVKIPQTKKVILLNLVLSLGLALLALGFMIITSYAVKGKISFPAPSIALFALGIILLVMVFGISRNGLILFFGCNLVLWGVLVFLQILGIIPLGFNQMWPLFPACCGISLFMVGIYKYKKIKGSYLFPSLAIMALSGLFFLFSARIITMPFARFIAFVWPVFVVIGGIALVLIFIFQHKNKEVFPYMTDDSDDPLEDDVFDNKTAEAIIKQMDKIAGVDE